MRGPDLSRLRYILLESAKIFLSCISAARGRTTFKFTSNMSWQPPKHNGHSMPFPMAGLPIQSAIVDSNRVKLEEQLLLSRSEQEVQVNDESNIAFDATYLQLKASSDLSFVLLTHACSSRTLDHSLQSIVNEAVLREQRQFILQIISEERFLLNQIRPEELTAFTQFSQAAYNKTKARQLSGCRLFHDISEKDLLYYCFRLYKDIGSKCFDLIDLFFRSSI